MDFSDLTPHGFCLAWQPGLIWLQAGSDLLIAAAYFSIPAALLTFLRRRRDLAFKPVFGLFAAFILACGTTHILGAVTLWLPIYWIDAGIKVLTAGLSVATAIMLWPLLPKALALPSPIDLHRANAALAAQIELANEATSRLQSSEARQKLLYARTPAALHAVDEQGVLVDVSDRWLDLVGYERADVIGRSILDFYEPDSMQESADHLAALRAGSLLRQASRRIRCRDGRILDLEVTLEVERDAAGRLERAFAAVTDVTAAREMEAALREAKERLHHAQKMEAVGRLTGGIAHDFNNLLTTIMGSLELLQQRSVLDERCTKLTANALEGSRRAARLTSQLLSFSRRARLTPEALLPGTVLGEVHDLLARTLGDRIGLEIVTAGEPDTHWPVLADRSQMEAVLLNLVINARDAIVGDGRVAIIIANCHAAGPRRGGPPDGIDSLPAGDYVSITVADTGGGMAEEVRARAFEPFFTTKEQGAGTGLGLSQTYGFVTQSGGAVRIESTPGQGTQVEMLLPRAGQLVPHSVAAAPSSTLVGCGEHILLVEDDSLLRHTIADALQARGFRVTQSGDGEHALQVLRGGGIDLVFADIRVPGTLSGVDLACAARARWPRLPVLLATGYADAVELEGFDEREEVLAKPYAMDDLVARILAGVGVRERA